MAASSDARPWKERERHLRTRLGISESQYRRHAGVQEKFDGRAETATAASTPSTPSRSSAPGPAGERKINRGRGTEEQRRDFTERTHEALLVFAELKKTSSAPRVKLARQALANVANMHTAGENLPVVSPEHLVKLNRTKIDLEAPLPKMGRPRNLPEGVEKAICNLALEASDAGRAHTKASLGRGATAYLMSAVEGQQYLERYKNRRLTKKNIADMIKRTDELLLEKVDPLAAPRFEAMRYDNYVEHYQHFAQVLLDLDLAVKNHEYVPGQPLSERIFIDKPGQIANVDEMALALGDGAKQRSVDNVRILRKLEQHLHSNKPAQDATTEEHAVHIAQVIRLKRRQKSVSMCTTHITLVVAHTFCGQLLPYMVIFQSDQKDTPAEWQPTPEAMRTDFTMRVNNKSVQCLFRSSPSGGMTKELWREFNGKILVPCLSTNVRGEAVKSLVLHDGDFSHLDSETWEANARAGIEMVVPPPGLTQDLQPLDAGEAFSALATTSWPNAKEDLSRSLLQVGADRGLTLCDVWRVLAKCIKPCLNVRALQKGPYVCGYMPYNQRVLQRPDIQLLKQKEQKEGAATFPRQLDLDKICFHLGDDMIKSDPRYSILWEDDSDPVMAARMDAAAAELFLEIGGGRHTSSKFWTHNLCDPRMTLVQKVYERHVRKKKELQATKSTAYQARRADKMCKLEERYRTLAPMVAKNDSKVASTMYVDEMKALLLVVYRVSLKELKALVSKVAVKAMFEGHSTKEPELLRRYSSALQTDAGSAATNPIHDSAPVAVHEPAVHEPDAVSSGVVSSGAVDSLPRYVH